MSFKVLFFLSPREEVSFLSRIVFSLSVGTLLFFRDSLVCLSGMSMRSLFFLLSVKTADVLHIKFIKVIVAPVNEAGPGNRVGYFPVDVS